MSESTGDSRLVRNGRPLRVLIIVENLAVPFDRRVWSEAKTLARAGCTVSVICPKGFGADRSYEFIDGVHIYRHNMPFEAKRASGYPLEYGWALLCEFFLAWRVLFAQGFDVIHACNPPDTIFLIAGFFKFLFGKKFIFDHHDINPELYMSKFGRKDAFYRLLVLLEWLTFKTADISLATNESYREIALTRGQMDPDDVFVVRSGPDLTRIQLLPPNDSLRQGRRFLVGYVGVIGAQEGIDLLLAAVKTIVEDHGRNDIHFGIVGGGPALDEMKRLAVTLGVQDYVTFTGRASDHDLFEMLNTADVCVNPDKADDMNDKSTMNKIMEYMALSKPIVQFDLTEGKVSARDASLYALRNDPRDMAAKILQLLDDPARRAVMGTFGRRRVENELSWAHEAPKLLSAYAALARRSWAVRKGAGEPRVTPSQARPR
ncbi:glycosyltransferase family 4 protein [Bradyrhizobium sp. U87765 SZCCT0131]|uniref:glycosyltransferase family 4 protein n=1 Tax=unclassified Bradyrhizobium TaxID=2631580 RepID=UPI001BA85553|nr:MULTISPECIES: glycosyltransferase family 4 protein [unclassified Bradyrhizobium]MBR1221742.1 glycosyltransferase family 4 protein [Bradyrhizobium sp. U87765 SZCCT0131]MBR1264335.1 glycosyltransferase family 4 protein [Bradyrhizobium sp. U87765 SZCCT0134]MBR1304758.1 glycosyltransferase family 4 protein [Bradyrhizobium sp. U87765 SZCCT0110]MBR1324094.1 glycosyltransferase family 4 protein [Bradyrhizobium sp. U87765 SZCCT0109]MBR1346687.1 glycosyltransferase family 4 protein [Bradyrhizobium s